MKNNVNMYKILSVCEEGLLYNPLFINIYLNQSFLLILQPIRRIHLRQQKIELLLDLRGDR